MTRFYVDKEMIKDDQAFITDDEDIYHFYKVLRARKGDPVIISDNDKYEYDCTVNKMTKKQITLDIAGKHEFEREPRVRMTLFQGVPKGGKMDDIIRKCIEIGIADIVPVRTARVEVKEKRESNLSNRLFRWKRIAVEASKQSRRGRVPEISDFITADEMFEKLKDFDFVIWPYEMETKRSIKERLGEIPESAVHIAMVIGPEGGFTPEEAEKLAEYKAVSLGKNILRTETAGLVTLSMIMYELEL